MATAYGTGAYLIILLNLIKVAFGQINYSISEDLEIGAVVGNIANDLVMDVRELLVRKLQLVLRGESQYFEVNTQSGILFVNERIDREQLCKEASTCSIRFDLAMVNPDEIFPVEVTILDKNDNSPIFPTEVISLQLPELLTPGARFPLESAHDPDVGLNSVANYHLSPNDFFSLKVQTRKGGRKIAELVLQKHLDRETNPYFQLVLTAVDGGNPHRSGTAQIVITVTDINDNAPAFDQDIYKAKVLENSPVGTLLIKLRANDLDEGLNAEFKYSFSNYASPDVRELFILDAETGEIIVNGLLDFEKTFDYELDVQAVDNLPNVGHAKVLVTVVDANDNAPDIKLTSVKNLISENATLGSVIAVFEVTDRDSGENGLVHCRIPENIPFKVEMILSNRYKIITGKKLDREAISQYNISISAWDAGSPSLTTIETISVSVSDINDNAPQFLQSSYDVYLMENNFPGRSIFSVTALDPDLENNGDVSYSILENKPEALPEPSFFAVSSKSGSIFALRSFDYEQVKNFQIIILARDAGSPSLSNTAIVRIIILDQNDNPPIIISPPAWNSSVALSIVPHSISSNSLVTKVIANDEDSGQNARLSFEIIEATDLSLFIVGLHTGEIRTTRSFIADDSTIQNLVVLVKDSGQPSLSSSVTICLSITANSSGNPSERANTQKNVTYFSDLNLYLIFVFGSTSLVFLLIIILLVFFKCKQDRSNSIYQNSAACCCCMQRASNAVVSRRSVGNELQNYYKAGQMLTNSDPYHYTVRLSPASSKSDFLFLSTCQPTRPLNDISADDLVVR
ncbi:protocadherin alpha-C2-like [Mobula birostris]|uniref:protocadherin alpha-C2-like n=1 Tax=Mobula birostris TaxID=1983395 RepID=UPI003B27E26B